MNANPPSSAESGSATSAGNRRAVSSGGDAMRVLLISHAEDMHDRYDHLGNESSGLTAQGWEQADILATWLRTHELVDVLVSDNLLQCRLTAQRVGQALGLPVAVHRELPMCTPLHDDGGPPSPAADGEVHASFRVAWRESSQDEPTPDDVNALVTVMDKLLREHWGGTLAVVTCPANIAALLCFLAGSRHMDVQVSHTSISEIAHVGNRWQIRYVNRCPHLPTPVVTPRNVREETPQSAEELEDLSTVVQVYARVAEGDLDRKRKDDQHRCRHLLSFAKLSTGLRILDIGTGIGLLPILLAEDGAEAVVGIDISPEMLEQAEFLRLSRLNEATARVSYRLAPANALPFRDESFDVVTSRLLLNHTRRPERILKEAVRVLKPGGILLVAELLGVDNSVKRATQDAIEERRNPAHVAARGAEQYAKLIADAGLQIESKDAVVFERGLDEWLAIYNTERADAAIVHEMIEAGLETDAAGINARRQGNRILFDQRMIYIKAIKPAKP
jgi:ubiquinone/menaquinone biosynthesis C-methylase UbiE/broad specificity phosphatase PhoE